MALALGLAFVNALATAGRRKGLRTVLAGLELAVLSTPVYWVGLLLLTVFSLSLIHI